MRRLIVFILIAFAAAAAYAQEHYSANVSLGARGGINLSRIFFNPSVKQAWPVNPTFGVCVRYIEENHFGIIGEVNYVRRGWKENFEGLDFRYQRNLDYIEIPVLAHIYFGRRARFFVNAGPQIAFRISESVSANFDPYDIASIPGFPLSNRRNSQLTEEVTQKVDYGVSAGIGCEYNINERNIISLEGRYYFGLGNIFPSKHQDKFRASNTMYIALTAGWWFRIK